MLNLTELRQVESHAKEDDRAIVSIRLESFSHLIDIAVAVRRSYEHSKRNVMVNPADPGFPVFLRECVRLSNVAQKLIEDVDVGDE